MTRPEMIDAMVRALRNDGEWPDSVSLATARQDRICMGRALDAIEPAIRLDERKQRFLRRLKFLPPEEAAEIWDEMQRAIAESKKDEGEPR